MATVKQLDSKRRAVFPDRFGPGDAFLEEVNEDRVTYRLIHAEDVPLAELRKEGGKHFVSISASREAIARAVRMDRDSR